MKVGEQNVFGMRITAVRGRLVDLGEEPGLGIGGNRLVRPRPQAETDRRLDGSGTHARMMSQRLLRCATTKSN